jgi:proteasome accessory factor B
VTDRVERLTNLLALLLETREPLSLVQIAGQMESQYPDGQSARRAAFERDKAALRDIGVPIEQEIVAGGEYAGQTRYWIDRGRYELRGLDLDDDESRALQVAMAATRPGSTSGQ